MGVSLRVFANDFTTEIGVLDQPFGIEWADERTDIGAAQFTIPHDSPVVQGNPSILDADNLVMVEIDGTPRFPWLIRRKQRSRGDVWDPIQVTGPGAAKALSQGLVYQPLGLDPEAPPTDERLFGWMARDYDDSWWEEEVQHGFGRQDDADIARYRGLPEGWPDGAAEWIWPEAVDGNLRNEVGLCYFRRTLDLTSLPAATGRARIYVTATSAFRAFLDGTEIASGAYWREYETADIDLYQQEHVIAFEVFNAPPRGGANPGGLLVSVWSLDEDDEPDEVLYRTFTGSGGSPGPWRVLAYPEDPPGVTPGFVLATLFGEAQDRGCFLPFSIDFDHNVDSSGEPWPEETELALQVGNDDVLSAAERLGDIGVTFNVTPDLVFQAFADRGVDRGETPDGGESTVTIALDEAREVQVETEDETVDVGLIRGGVEWIQVPEVGPTSNRREGFVSLGLNPTTGQARKIGQDIIDGFNAPRRVVRFAVNSGQPGVAVPFVDFDVSDTIVGPTLDEEITADWREGDVKIITLAGRVDVIGAVDWYIEACPDVVEIL